MNDKAPMLNNANTVPINFDVKEKNFEENEKAIPIAGRFDYANGSSGSAIGDYLIAPSGGTYVLGSINGSIQWIATNECQ